MPVVTVFLIVLCSSCDSVINIIKSVLSLSKIPIVSKCNANSSGCTNCKVLPQINSLSLMFVNENQ